MSLVSSIEVKDYTEFEVVKARCDNNKILHDILKAESEIYSICGHKFEEYTTVPEQVKLACVGLAEYYALIAGEEGITKGYISERLSDYSYSMKSDGSLNKPVYMNLLREYIKTDTSTIGKKVKFKMRAI